MRSDERLVLAQRILRHLQANPEAKETLEGIAEWWLLQERIAEAVEQVSEAIEWLVVNGYLLEKGIAGGKTLYEINQDKWNEITELLKT
jgi:hypothetical protein